MKESILKVLIALSTIEVIAMLYLNERELMYVFAIVLFVSILERHNLNKQTK